MTIELQVSIGYTSIGLMFRAIGKDELPALIAQAARETGYTAEIVEAKLAAGGTLWIDSAADRKIRGYDAAAAEAATVRREAQRQERARADGYFSNY